MWTDRDTNDSSFSLHQRIDGLQVGDSVRFNGEYVWNEKGVVIHWTHHDPQVGMSQVGYA